jgi:transposase
MALDRQFRAFDFRKLPPAEQAQQRRRAVQLVEEGSSVKKAAEAVGVKRCYVTKWLKAYERGDKELKGGRRGRRAGEPHLVQEKIAIRINRLIVEKHPDMIGLPYALWTPEAVSLLIEQETGRRPDLRTASLYLQRWGFVEHTPKPLCEVQAEQARRWFATDYPAIIAETKSRKAQIHWLRETVLSQRTPGVGMENCGEQGVVGPATFFAVTMMSSVSSRGRLRFMIYDGSLNAPAFLIFLRRLTRDIDRPAHMIVDDHPAHCHPAVKEYVTRARDKIRLFYSPVQLNRPVGKAGLGG